MKVILFITFLMFILTSCTSVKEAGQVLRNEKVKTTDEFLVKKKQPLILPPDYDKIPEPGSTNKIQNNDKNKISVLKIYSGKTWEISAMIDKLETYGEWTYRMAWLLEITAALIGFSVAAVMIINGLEADTNKSGSVEKSIIDKIRKWKKIT